ncbi:hypothetical protein ERW51_07155 [Aliivibrio finisterrensis]|jgi:hypothetical protein|uniref:hypothetical protein n=1 Tax=Aliivibrio finisterrensis TaxID=511998 RepID=UPI00101EFC70|nr:hypothetical protein [Aliivibrio finisterrensis]RYU68657.1 hypothetical protein ERW54_07680 [Aliivibrio finisterrensis]RYU72936.1 hypothetical protein ERW51_07130 [Aliivibrio finisterrensis]RYU72941.1 hypothetical protein ERW51_07155 [Aliivibrio finisterrensis]RYU75262.1 hypothetical protein ERW48_09735 [Aliivibrio finisterrensis]RYU75267.1 hypothetical protein ERW48_09760 [Aliivibrio finisterrensis]
MTIPNCSISDARDLVSDLNNISLFLDSGVWQEEDGNEELLNMLLLKLRNKIETLEACLSYVVNAPLIEAERLLEEVPGIKSK